MTGPRLIGTLDWAERCVNLERGRFDRERYPQLIPIAETVDRRMGCIFVLRFPPQTFKSLFLQLRLLRTVVVAPARTLWYCLTATDADDFSQEKLLPLMQSIPSVMARLPRDVRDRGGHRLIRFVDAPVSLLSSKVQSHRNQRSGQDLYLDESWQYPAGAITEILARSDDYKATRRVILAETGPDEGSESDQLFERGTKNVWHCACPLCSQLIEMEFGDLSSEGGMKWDKNAKTCNKEGFWDVDAAAATAKYVCPACKSSMKWSSGLMRDLNSPARGAKYIAKNQAPDPSIESWTANALCFRDWPGLVADWLGASNARRLGDLSLLEEFTRKRLVKSWSPIAHYETKVEYPVGDYVLGQKWDGELTHPLGFRCRFVSVDVQMSHYWVLCRSWGKYGRSRLYGWKKCYGGAEVAQFAKDCEVDPAFVFVDSAYDPRDPDSKGAMWGRTMRMCSDHGFVATNGTGEISFKHKDGTLKLYSEAKSVDAWQGTELFGRRRRVPLIHYSSRGSKFMLHNLRMQRDEEGLARWTIAANSNEDYRKQAYAERLRKKKSSRGAMYWEWYASGDNHAFDLECAQVVVAYMFGLVGGEGSETAEALSATPESDAKALTDAAA